jgi:hypothetical protein
MSTIDELMNGAIDFHVHASPDPLDQKQRVNAYELALQAKEAGMKAVVLKCHRYCTAPLAYIVNQIVPEVSLIGSLVINKGSGGLNPDIVDTAARVGAKVVWMPTYSSVIHNENTPQNGIPIIDKDGKLVPQIAPILEIIKSYNLVLGTGHISIPEAFALVAEARRAQIKVTITHPLSKGISNPTLEQHKELVGKGAYIEHCFVACMPILGALDPAIMVKHIKAVGAEHCILSTDFGQDMNPAPTEGFRMMLANMLEFGLSEKELETMVKVNPARLLDLA